MKRIYRRKLLPKTRVVLCIKKMILVKHSSKCDKVSRKTVIAALFSASNNIFLPKLIINNIKFVHRSTRVTPLAVFNGNFK